MAICLIPCLLTTNLQAKNEDACMGLINTIKIDKVWAGTGVRFDAIENESYVYIAYYDAERWLTVAQYNKCNGNLEKIRLPSQFDGWDAHNHLTLVFDQEGKLHISGNMHASALIYARMNQPDELNSLAQLQPMTGQLESRVTYPKFFTFNDGKLGFMYRHGGSGNGVEIINRYENGQWNRWLDQPLFAPADSNQPVNAYHTGFKRDADGFFHIAWVWRSNKNVESNFNINYAKSPDLKTWSNSQGEELSLPITPESNVMVDMIAQETGLFNNIRLGFDLYNQPVISYVKFDDHGLSQLYHARPDNGNWQISTATNWDYRWNPRGGGTIIPVIYFSGVMQSNGQIIEHVHHNQYGDFTFEYDNNRLDIKNVLYAKNKKHTQNNYSDINTSQVLNIIRTNNQPAKDTLAKSYFEISWTSYIADNRDRPRHCESMPCHLTSDLTLSVKGLD